MKLLMQSMQVLSSCVELVMLIRADIVVTLLSMRRRLRLTLGIYHLEMLIRAPLSPRTYFCI